MNRIKQHTDGVGRSTDALEQEIESTRNRMDSTIDELAHKLNPDHYVNDALDWLKAKMERVDAEAVKHSAADLGKKTGKAVKENPLPFALGGLAIASIFMPRGSFRRRSEEPYVPAHPGAEGATGIIDPTINPGVKSLPQESIIIEGPNRSSSDPANERGKARRALFTAKEKVSGSAHRVGDSVSDAASSAKSGVKSAASSAKSEVESATDSVKSGISSAATSTKARMSSAAASTKSGAKSAATTAKTTLSEATHKTEDALKGASASTREAVSKVARTSKERFYNGKEEYPGAMCLGALAVGFLAALGLPRTRRENTICGETSDELKERVAEKGKEKLTQAQNVALEKQEEAVDKLQAEAEKKLDTAQDKIDEKIETHVDPA
ncbi:MAG: DUF3618 domain-containing protein [Verrucomicrobiales bacterium]